MKNLITRSALIVATASSLLLAGCGGGGAPMNNAQGGAIAGAVLGGVVGHQFGQGDGKDLATVAGALLGGYIGGQMGAQMDARDRGYVGQAVSSGRPTNWQNPNTGYRYNANPGPIQQDNYQGQRTQCRPVFIDGYIDGRQEQIQMKACRGANGQWQSVN